MPILQECAKINQASGLNPSSKDLYQSLAESIGNIAKAEHLLRENGVIFSTKEISQEIGEWLGAEIFDWTKSAPSAHKPLMLLTKEGKAVQVKIFRRPTNPNSDTRASFLINEEALLESDYFLLFAFDTTRKVRHLYLLGREDVPRVGRRIGSRLGARWDLRQAGLRPFEVFSTHPLVKQPDLFRLMHLTGR